MPVKVRCRSCEAVLQVPDKARGKVVACKSCGNKIRVPDGSGGAKRRKKASAPKADDGANPFGDLDLDSMTLEDRDSRICPYCTAEMSSEDPVCRQCGMNVETGKMDAREQKKRTRRGPDPAKFYKMAWSNSWEFIKRNKGLAIMTGLVWSLFGVANATCAYMWIDFCERLPPKTFWAFLTILTGIGIPGWYWVLALKIIDSTVLKEKLKSDRIQFDFFQSVASGIRATFWPVIVMAPVLGLVVPVALLVAFGQPMLLIPIVLGVVALPGLFLPIAMIHMTTKYSYKGWIFWELLKLAVKNLGATLYLLVVIGLIHLPVVALWVGLYFLIKTNNPYQSEVVLGYTERATSWILEVAGFRPDPKSFTFMIGKGMFNILAAVLLLTPIQMIAAWPALFSMRAIGLFGLYNQETLGLVRTMRPGTPATFWVRFLAHTIDSIFWPMASVLVTAEKRVLMLGWALNGIGTVVFMFSPAFIPVFGVLWQLYMNWMYWAVQESSNTQTTMGKDAFGLIVVTEKDKTMTLKDASVRWFLRLISDVLLGLPYLLCLFNPERQTLHDRVSKTKVVWRGDR